MSDSREDAEVSLLYLSHTGVNIREVCKLILKSFGVDIDYVNWTTDRASNMVKAFSVILFHFFFKYLNHTFSCIFHKIPGNICE